MSTDTHLISEDCNPAFAQARDQIRWYVIGFVWVFADSNGKSGGSGTLVTINGAKGILTAAHVVKALKKHKKDGGEVGIVRFVRSPTQLQQVKLPMEHIDDVSLGQEPWSSKGPDLAFLTLPPNIAGALAATNSFYDLSSKRADALSSIFPAGKHFSCIAGVVHERTTDVTVPDNAAKKKLFEALCEPGRVSNPSTEDGYDLLDFDAAPHDDGPGPSSYKGVSGAALWRVYCDEDTEGKPTRMTKLWLHGVAFHQQKHDSCAPTIRCHGPVSVFDKLLSRV